MCGDATNPASVAALMRGELAALCFTSPPYAQQRDYRDGNGSDWDTLMRGVYSALPMRDDGQVLVNLGIVHRRGEVQEYYRDWIDWMRAGGWRFFGTYVWDKCAALPGSWHGRLAPAHEFVFHFNRIARLPNKIVPKKTENIRRKTGTGIRQRDGTMSGVSNPDAGLQTHKIPDSVIRMPPEKRHGVESEHPAVFPVALPRHIIESYTDVGDIVYEPFGGSGTQIVAAEQTGRVCRVMELSPEYCQIALRRWLKAGGVAPVLIERVS